MSFPDNDQDIWECDPSDLLWEPPSSLRLDYWKRSPKTQEAKDSHIEYLETLPYSREELILRTVLKAGIPVAIEKNLFPYETPPNIEHWTLWSREELSHRSICYFIEDWCKDNDIGKDIVEWNYEENAHRSFDVPHVHVFFRFAEKRGEVCSSISHSKKRSFSSSEESEDTSEGQSSSDSDGQGSDSDDNYSHEDNTSSRKKVCSTRVNLLSSSVEQTDRHDRQDALSRAELIPENVCSSSSPKKTYREGISDTTDEYSPQ